MVKLVTRFQLHHEAELVQSRNLHNVAKFVEVVEMVQVVEIVRWFGGQTSEQSCRIYRNSLKSFNL